MGHAKKTQTQETLLTRYARNYSQTQKRQSSSANTQRNQIQREHSRQRQATNAIVECRRARFQANRRSSPGQTPQAGNEVILTAACRCYSIADLGPIARAMLRGNVLVSLVCPVHRKALDGHPDLV